MTPAVLVEYNYHNLSTINNQIGDTEHMVDLGKNNSNIISNGYTGTRVFQMNPANDNFVLPINKSESKFINSKTVNFGYSSDFKLEYHYEDVGNYDMNDDSVDNDSPYGEKIGDGAPFSVDPDELEDAIVESIQRNLKKKSN